MAGNTFSTDAVGGAPKIYKHTGFSSTISSSFSSPSTGGNGVSWDSINVLSTDNASDFIYKHTGFTTTIADSFSSPSTGPRAVGWDGTNILSSDNASDKIYLHSGFTTTISNSFSSPSTNPTASSWDSANVISSDVTANFIYKHTGFTTTIADSFSSPGTNAAGAGWDGTNVLSCDGSAGTGGKIYQHTGFSSTVADSFSSPSDGPLGVADDSWDGTKIRISFDAASNSGYQTAQTTYSWAHTCTGNSRYLIVGVSMLSVAGSSVTSITYNSIAMGFLGAVASASGAVRAELWGLVAPAAGSNTIAVTLSTGLDSIGCAVSFMNINQSSSTEGVNTATATNVGAADATVGVTTVATNDWVVDQVATDDTAITVGAGQTSRNNATGTLGSGADSTELATTPAVVTMSWTNVAALATWSIVAIALRDINASTIVVVPFSGNQFFQLMGVGK